MKAIFCQHSGTPDVLELKDMPVPAPDDNEVLVRVIYATVTRGDVHLRKMSRFLIAIIGTLFGFKAMKIPGVEFSGVVEETGSKVSRFKKGDEVTGTTTGLKFGANAEYVCVPENPKKGVLALKPAGLSFDEAAAASVGGMTAMQLLKKADYTNAESVCVYGASGSVGSSALQVAKSAGLEVTGVCSEVNIKMVRLLGADKTVDYTKEDFTSTGEKYDIIFDAVGKLSKSVAQKALTEKGRFVSIKSPTGETEEDHRFILDLAAEQKLRVPLDKVYTLDQVPEAHRYVESGRKKGNVVIKISD